MNSPILTPAKKLLTTEQESMPKVAVFMPCLNEQKTLGQNLEVIRYGLERGVIDRFVLVLDGCSDRSPEIAAEAFNLTEEQSLDLIKNHRPVIFNLENGAEVILASNERNGGKGYCFGRALWTLEKHGFFEEANGVLVNIDSDATNLLPGTAFRLAKELIETESKMLLGATYELQSGCDYYGKPLVEYTPAEYNGFRAMRISELKPLLVDDPKWHLLMPTGLCIEKALNLLVYGKNLSPQEARTTHRRKIIFGVTGKNVHGERQADEAYEIEHLYKRMKKDGIDKINPRYTDYDTFAKVFKPQ